MTRIRVGAMRMPQRYRAGTDDGPRSLVERGQVLIMFASILIVLLLFSALVIDLAWLWSNSLKVQRAADAAALAGVIHLPGDVSAADAAAFAEATKNGYTNLSGGVHVTPGQDPNSPRRMDVTISAPVQTFFLNLIGMDTVTVSRKAKAEYVLPVPMGSPLNYYGVFGTLRSQSGGTNQVVNDDTGLRSASTTKATNNTWTNTGNVYTVNSQTAYTTNTSTSNGWQQWGNFSFPSIPGSATIDGIEVHVKARSADNSGCRIRVQLSWNNGSSWTTYQEQNLTNSDPGGPDYYTLGADNYDWGHSWSTSSFTNTNFQIELLNRDPGSSCSNNSRMDVDWFGVQVFYHTTTFIPDQDVKGPNGETLTPQGFWGEMLSQGAESSSGDAYLPYYVQDPSKTNPEQDTTDFYDYAVEMPPGSTGGHVYIYDPGFCNTGSFTIGTGDQWYSGSSPVSAFYTLYDMNGTPYNLGDDPVVGSAGNTFRRLSGSESSGNCDPYHDGWYQLPLTRSTGPNEAANGLSGGAAGRVYRLRTTSYDPTDVSGQRNTSANNSFALFADATGGTPKVYGVGAMEMFTPLPGGQESTFYLAQIDPIHAGKTMEIKLWDAGDTNQNAYIQILKPTTTGWTWTPIESYQGQRGQPDGSGNYIYNSNASNCNSYSGTNVSSVQTYQGSSRFNGCWLTLDVQIPVGYTGLQSGWWKISYTMQGNSGTSATDITTWQVDIRGNPVHLVEP
jgi:Putative Flp pilus-assembly TadE/G-like